MTTTPNLSPEDRARLSEALKRPPQPRRATTADLTPTDSRWVRVQDLTPMETER